jgi:hypothetical protein
VDLVRLRRHNPFMRLTLLLAMLGAVGGCQAARTTKPNTPEIESRGQATQPTAISPASPDVYSGFKLKTEALLLAVNEWKPKPDGEDGNFNATYQRWTASLSDREKRYAATSKMAEAIDLLRRRKVAARLSEENAGLADNSPLPESKALLALSMTYFDESEALAAQAEKALLDVRRLLDAGEAGD